MRSLSVFLVLIIHQHLQTTGMCYNLHTLLWTTDNPLFSGQERPSLRVLMGDSIDFLCPQLTDSELYRRNSSNSFLYMSDFAFYKVEKDGFNNCSSAEARHVFRCNKPRSDRYYTLNIAQYSSIPGGIEHRCNSTSYFLAKEFSDDESSGMCRTFNTRLVVHVDCPYTSLENEQTNAPPLQITKESNGSRYVGKPSSPETNDDILLIATLGVCIPIALLSLVAIFILCFCLKRRRDRHSASTSQSDLIVEEASPDRVIKVNTNRGRPLPQIPQFSRKPDQHLTVLQAPQPVHSIHV